MHRAGTHRARLFSIPAECGPVLIAAARPPRFLPLRRTFSKQSHRVMIFCTELLRILSFDYGGCLTKPQIDVRAWPLKNSFSKFAEHSLIFFLLHVFSSWSYFKSLDTWYCEKNKLFKFSFMHTYRKGVYKYKRELQVNRWLWGERVFFLATTHCDIDIIMYH